MDYTTDGGYTFTNAEIKAQMSKLSDYYTWHDVLTYYDSASATIDQLIAFRELQKSFPGTEIRNTYGNVSISRKLPKSERRARAVKELTDARRKQEQLERERDL